ncbi:MAG: beta-propeller fold lactonase family protein, partial [Polyangiaceae bacterium]|nr:beta-propeller fold lactonase family protein [Polyangiaceae bacterium]
MWKLQDALKLAIVASAAQVATPALAQTIGPQPGSDTVLLPTGKFVSPTAIPGSNLQLLNPQLPDYPNFIADEAVKSALSPDGNTLAIITSGYQELRLATGKKDSTNFTQYLFTYDVSGESKAAPKLTQVLKQNNAFAGLIWSGNTTLYASGGPDDKIYVYTRADAAPSSPLSASGSIALGHTQGIGDQVGPNVDGLALSADGKILVAANTYNNSISVVDAASRAVVADYDLRPYNTSGQDGVAGGEFPWAVALGDNGIAFVSSLRDREVVVVDLSAPASPKFVTRIHLAGNAYGMTFSADQSRLYVAEENSDQVAVIDTHRYAVVHTIDTRAPGRILADPKGRHDGWGRGNPEDAPRYTGVETIAVTLSPDGRTLYAVNNGNNSIAVIPLGGRDADTVTALIPTAYAPKDITFSSDGSQMYIINGLSDTGPNPSFPDVTSPVIKDGSDFNEYQFALERASLVTAPVPAGPALGDLTRQVVRNNLYSVPTPERDLRVMNFLHEKIKHVIYIKRENRTFDQVLGDLNNGSNGDPSLTQFGAAIRPNDHVLAKSFVTLDNFMDPGDGSESGWSWTFYGGTTTMEEITQQNDYAGRPFTSLCCGLNNSVADQLLTTAERDSASSGAFSADTASLPGGTLNVLPGPADLSLMDAPFGYQKSSIWDAVLNAGGTIRDYGLIGFNVGPMTDANGNPITDPFAAGVVEFTPVVQSWADDDRSDLYFRTGDHVYPDTWRFQEWFREFKQFEENGQLPSLSMIDFRGDHMGSFSTAFLNTPETQQADNDFAVGKLVEAVAHSRYAKDTLVIVIEDDSQDGPDHVDSHRAPAWVVGPYVKKGAVVSTFYTLASVLRTIEDILGT